MLSNEGLRKVNQRGQRFPVSLHTTPACMWVKDTVLNCPHQTVISRRWPETWDGQSQVWMPACQREPSPTPSLYPSTVLLYWGTSPKELSLLSPLFRAPAFIWFYSSIQWSLSEGMKGQCNSQVKPISELYVCSSANGPKPPVQTAQDSVIC